jgi:hypothetical protein
MMSSFFIVSFLINVENKLIQTPLFSFQLWRQNNKQIVRTKGCFIYSRHFFNDGFYHMNLLGTMFILFKYLSNVFHVQSF